MANAVASRIDYNAATQQELLAFVEQKAQVLGLSGPIHLKFFPFQYRDARGPKLAMGSSESFWNSRVTYYINTDSTVFHNLNELKFGLAQTLSRSQGPARRVERVIEKILSEPFVVIITAIVLGTLHAMAVIHLPLWPFIGYLTAAAVVDTGLRIALKKWFFTWRRSLELKADRKACEICNPAERQAGIDLFTRCRDQRFAYRNAPNLEAAERSRREAMITPEGERVGDHFPSHSERLRLIQSYA